MRIKKILSLAVVLAMVLTVVPMFGITASAAEAPSGKWLAYKDAYFDSVNGGVGNGTNEQSMGGGVYVAGGQNESWSGGTGQADGSNFQNPRHAVFGYKIPDGVTSDNISKATIYLHISGVKQIKSGATIAVYKESNTTWTEDNFKMGVFGATPEDAKLGEKLGESQAINKGTGATAVTYSQWVSVDATDYVKELAESHATEMSIRVAGPAGGIGISSRENGEDLTSYIEVEYIANVTVNYINASKENIGQKTVKGIVGKALELTNDVAPIILENDGKVYARNIGQNITLTNDLEQTVDVTYTEATSTTNYEDTRDAKLFAMEYTQAAAGLYKDIGITDANGNTVAGFTIDDKKIWIADGERTLALKAGNRRVTNGTKGRDYCEGIIDKEYSAGDTMRIVVENYDGGYDVTYISNGSTLATVKYTGVAYGISSPDKWDYTGGGNTVSSDNATEIFTDVKFYVVKPSEINEYVKNAMLDAVNNSIPNTVVGGETIDLKESVKSSLGTHNITYTGDLCDDAGLVSDVEAVLKADISYTIDFNGQTEERTKTVEIFPASRVGKTYATNDALYNLDSTNIIAQTTAASFEDENGNFSTKGWTDHKGGDIGDAKPWWNISKKLAHSTNNSDVYINGPFSIPDGNCAFGSRYNDTMNSDKVCTIQTYWPVTKGEYYMSFYVKGVNASIGAKGIYAYFSKSEIFGKQDFTALESNAETSQFHQVSTTKEWQKYEFVFDVTEDSGYIGFIAYNLGGNDNAINNIFDNFELYKATKQTETLSKIEDIPVVTGTTKDQLPTTVTGVYTSDAGERKAPVEIAWDEEQSNTTYTCENGNQTYQVSGKVNGQSFTVNVVAYHDFSVEQKSSDKNQYMAEKHSIKFPVPATKNFTAEFTVNFNEAYDNWIMFNSPSFESFFGGDQVLIGFDRASALRPVNGNGSGDRANQPVNGEKDVWQADIELNKDYTFVVTVDVEEKKYNLWAFDDKGEQIAKVEDFGFRTNKDDIDTMFVFSNEGENVKSDRFSVSDVKITYDTVPPTTYKVTAKYYTTAERETPAYTVEKYAKPNGSVSFDAIENMFVGDAFYSADATTVTNVNEEGKSVDVQLVKNANMPVADKMFMYDVTTDKNATATDDVNDTGYDFQPLGWGNNKHYAVIMSFNVPSTLETEKIESAKLNLYSTKTNNGKEEYGFCVYAINPENADFVAKKLTPDGLTTDGWVDSVDAVKVFDGTYKFNVSNDAASDFNLDIDLSKVAINDDNVILAFVNKGCAMQLAGLNFNEGKNAPYLSNITTATAPTEAVGEPTLGWQGNKFTINYPVDTGKKVLIYHENPVTGALLPITTESGVVTSDDGVAIATDNTNRIYAAAIYDAVAGTMSAKTSIYSLVVDEILKESYTADNIDSAKLAEVNKVIANGGIYYTGDLKKDSTQLADKTSEIMSVTDDNKITINDKLVELNIGFVYNGGKLYIGSNTEATVSVPVEDSDMTGTYKTLTVGDGTVTLSDKIEDGAVVEGEAITLSLDSVNIEFIETLIEEAEADGADAEADFIPEL